MSNPVTSEQSRAASHIRWASVGDRTAETQALRNGFRAKLEQQARELLGPDATDVEIARSADNLLKAHYARMRANSIKTRQAKAAARKQAEVDAMLDALTAGGEG